MTNHWFRTTALMALTAMAMACAGSDISTLEPNPEPPSAPPPAPPPPPLPPPPPPPPDPDIKGIAFEVEYIRADQPGSYRYSRISSLRLRPEETVLLGLSVHDIHGVGVTADSVEWIVADTVTIKAMEGQYSVSGRAWAPVIEVQGVQEGQTRITARQRGHEAILNVLVQADEVIADRSSVDRPDDFDGPQVHFVYATVADGRDLHSDQDGYLNLAYKAMQGWAGAQAEYRWHVDTYEGQPDISFIELDPSTFPFISGVEAALKAREGGSLPEDKMYAVFLEYDGAQGALPYTGVAIADRLFKITLALKHFEQTAGIATHELLHLLGAVPSCAPNVEGGHATDYALDIMQNGTFAGGVLDWNNDDYFGHGRTDCVDTANSEFWSNR